MVRPGAGGASPLRAQPLNVDRRNSAQAERGHSVRFGGGGGGGGGGGIRLSVCSGGAGGVQHFVSFTTMNMIARTRDQLRDTLARCGISESLAAARPSMSGQRRVVLLRAVVTAALWPSVALVAGTQPTRSKDGAMGSQLLVRAQPRLAPSFLPRCPGAAHVAALRRRAP